jgi:hypothetical protein
MVLGDVPELFATRGLLEIRRAIGGERTTGALMAQGRARTGSRSRRPCGRSVGKEAGDIVHVRIDWLHPAL